MAGDSILLVDSCVLFAFFDETDAHHLQAIKDFERAQENGNTIWITTHVLDETVSLLIKYGYTKTVKNLLELIDVGSIKIYLPASQQIEFAQIQKTIKLVLDQGKRKASFTDLHQLVIANSDAFTEPSQILSYDHHLQKK